MSLSATLFGTNSLIFKATNILGLGIPGLLHKAFGPQDPEPMVNAIGDISRQTAKEGDPRTIVWGRVRPIGGNIIHCQSPVKRWIVTSTSSGGKGGGKKQKQRTEHVYRTYAIGVCEGPITAFSRIWRNNKLVYDGRGTEWGAKNNGVFLQNFRLYLGGWDQMPSPELQAIWGAGTVPAYRGTAYMVALDEDLTDQGGMVPQWLFEVERAEGSYLTSKPYAVECVDAVSVNRAGMQHGIFRRTLNETESLEEVGGISGELAAGIYRDTLAAITTVPEDFYVSGGLLASGVYYSSVTAVNAGHEQLGVIGGALIAGSCRLALKQYTHPQQEKINIEGGSLWAGTYD